MLTALSAIFLPWYSGNCKRELCKSIDSAILLNVLFIRFLSGLIVSGSSLSPSDLYSGKVADKIVLAKSLGPPDLYLVSTLFTVAPLVLILFCLFISKLTLLSFIKLQLQKE